MKVRDRGRSSLPGEIPDGTTIPANNFCDAQTNLTEKKQRPKKNSAVLKETSSYPIPNHLLSTAFLGDTVINLN